MLCTVCPCSILCERIKDECVGPSPSDIRRGSNVHVGHLALHLSSLCDVKCQPAASRESKVSLHSNAYARRLSRLTPKAVLLWCRAIKAERERKCTESLAHGFLFKEEDVGWVGVLKGKALSFIFARCALTALHIFKMHPPCVNRDSIQDTGVNASKNRFALLTCFL